MNNNGFIELPKGNQTWFIDTCIWSEIISSDEVTEDFITYFHKNNLLAGLTSHTLFELSRAGHLLQKYDNLFEKLQDSVWLAMPYDDLFDLELQNYPSQPNIKWFPITRLFLEGNRVSSVIEQLIKKPLFVRSRQDAINFGNEEFMSLNQFKENFHPVDGLKYTTEQANTFAQLNAISYFLKHETLFLKRVGVRNFLPEGISSLYARSLFLFFKYYIHGQTPGKSDFIDYVHISYLPYVNVYATEINASNVIRHIQSIGLNFAEKNILNMSQFLELIKKK